MMDSARFASSIPSSGPDFSPVSTSPGMRISQSQVCADGWLQVKHQCLICKTEVEQVDRYSQEKLRIEENAFMPPISQSLKPEETAEVTYSHQSASQALNKEFFVEEFTKLLSTIHHKHATYISLKDQRYSGVCHSYATVTQHRQGAGGHAQLDPRHDARPWR